MNTVVRAVTGLMLTGVLHSAGAGVITSVPSASGAAGFGGWNLANVTVTVPGGSFDVATGAYSVGPDGLYWSDVDDGTGTVMARVLAKDWPIGEPPGIKVINDDALVQQGKPQNCIIATSYLDPDYLDTASPVQVICSSPFQSHKRFKVTMLPSTVDSVGSESIDLVFNVQPDAGSRDYQVFQKINNWTGKRLEGFTIQVGFGVGAAFQTVTQAGIPLASLSVSVPGAVWDPEDLATFSHGLFGPADKHFPTDGFFDDVRAGFQIDEYPVDPGMVDTLTATTTLASLTGSNYADVPPGAGAAADQFGPWLPNIWLPKGIFFDFDSDPDTDDQLVAWFGYNPATSAYEWMYGGNGVVGTPFGTVTASDLVAWAVHPDYYIGEIDDLVNIGLNYQVTVGDVSAFPATASNTFTIRITPTPDTSGTGAPGYVAANPPGMGVLVATAKIIPEDDISITVTDSDLNASAALVETATVTAENTVTTDQYTVTLTETGPDTGVFTGTLTTYDRTHIFSGPPAADLGVTGGDTVTTTYVDSADALGKAATLTADTTVVDLVIAAGGGGGCAASGDAGLDPTLPLLALLAVAWLVRRRLAG